MTIRSKNWLERLVQKKRFWILFIAFGVFVPIYKAVNRTLPPPPPVYSSLPEFELVDENSNVYHKEDILGKVSIFSFMFTSCPSSCPALMEKFQAVQKRVRGVGQKIRLHSVTVDPKHDTPKVLFKYARKLNANPHIWKFLTGSRDRIEDLLVNYFMVPIGDKELTQFQVADQESNTNAKNIDLYDIAHSNKFVLVDQDGQVRGYYSTENAGIDQLMIDVGLLVNGLWRTKLKQDKE